jgi:NADPH-dependent 2,4-dienoyl-CoA reductase/sulfur reductase-like enzyme/ferredoxin
VAPDSQPVPVSIAPRGERPAFPNYLELRVRVPIGAWRAVRLAVFAAAAALCLMLVLRPATGLDVFWHVVIPILPIVWFAFPGLWRNVCPLATANQTPRVFGFSRGRTLPQLLSRFAYVVGIAVFLGLVPARLALFNRSGPATAVLLVTVVVLAFAGGVLFKGKSGWCATVCPLLPVQRLYGETPFLLVRNSHCEPCVGCAKNCFDFNPRVAKLADLDDEDPRYAGPRRFFAAAFPGLVFGFFSISAGSTHSVAWIYGHIAVAIAISVGVFFTAEVFLPLSSHKVTALFAAAALNAFYWYSVPTLVDAIGASPGGAPRSVAVWTGRAVVLGLTIPWLARTFAKESAFEAAKVESPVVDPVGLAVLRERAGEGATVRLGPDGPEVAVTPGTPLLDVIEASGSAIEAGCRMGFCGADPVAVVDGAASLSPIGGDEAATLARLGLADSTRLACQARVHGSCAISLTPERAAMHSTTALGAAWHDEAVRRLVIIGNGIAGATAADHARRVHPDCEIHLVGREPHRLYNRMAISRLIYGRSAMQGLYLLPDGWEDDNGVTCWLNTRARSIDRAAGTVALATGQTLEYDRLILATGSRSVVLDIPGVALAGSFTLRSAEDAIAIRACVQDDDVEEAVVAGGGLLGVESAYALHKLGVATTVLERGPWLLGRQLDEPAARLLERYLEALGITVVTDASAREVVGTGRVTGVRLLDGRDLVAGLFLACPGFRPDTELASGAGLCVAAGVVVDDHMRSDDPRIFAAGDNIEFDGQVTGLWPQSARQGEVAGVNAVGGDTTYDPPPPSTVLKVVGVDLASIGRFDASEPDDVVVAIREDDDARYRKLVISRGRVVGGILVGHSAQFAAVQQAVTDRRDVLPVLDALRAGDWSVLEATPTPVGDAVRATAAATRA